MTQAENNRRKSDKWQPTERTLKLAAKFRKESYDKKSEWLSAQRERHPVHTPTGETGTLAGIIGYLTAAGVRQFPYFETPQGVFFCEHKTGDGDKTTLQELNIEQIRRRKSALLFDPETFLGTE